MALSAGVSPFEIPDFVGMDVAEVEEVFDQQDSGVRRASPARWASAYRGVPPRSPPPCPAWLSRSETGGR